MVDLIFDIGGSGGDVTVTGQVVYGTKFYDERYNQYSMRTAEGFIVTYDTGTNIVIGEIIIKAVSYINGEQLRTWLHDKAIYMLNKFSITVPPEVDLGEGKDGDLTAVCFNGKDDKGVFQYNPPGIYKIKFPYTYVRGSGGHH